MPLVATRIVLVAISACLVASTISAYLVASTIMPEAKPNAKVEIVGRYNCEEQDPKVEVHVEKEVVLEKYSLENADQFILVHCFFSLVDGAAKKPIEDAEGQTKTSEDQLQKETGENSNMESGRKDAATSNIDNLDHIISTIAKSTMKDPLDVDTSFRVEGQVPCASNIEDQEDKNIEFMVMQVVQVVQLVQVVQVIETEIIIDKYEPPWKDGDASVDAGGAVGAGSVGEATDIIIKNFESPQEDGDASVDVGGETSCARGAVGAAEDMKMIIKKCEPPQEDGDASVDAGGAVGAGGAEYVRHNDGMVSWQREDGDGAGGVAGYVRSNDGTVSCPWEDPGNILFESKPALILDINGVLLTSVDKRYHSQIPTYWNDLEIVDRVGVFDRYKRDAVAFLDWCLVHFDVFVWTCCMKNKAEKILRVYFPDQFCQFKEILAQQDCVRGARF
ncbi:hypothetical protein L7F22_015259 [Adiantum nelumboides]|nr:hypothetical protein [Adiantum nelumboides]